MKYKHYLLLLILSLFIVACGGGTGFNGGSSLDPKDDTVINNTLKAGEVNPTLVESASRGKVNLDVYLPPDWKKDDKLTYPVIFFLHGSGGNEKSFFRSVSPQQLNRWITQNDLPAFILVSIASHHQSGSEQQWSTSENEEFLTSAKETELRAFVLKNFNKNSTDKQKISIHGHSRGARGALHYALKFSDKFTSAVADAFVSDYALDEEKGNALQNKQKIIASGIKLRMSIGDIDSFDRSRQTSPKMHNYLDSLVIPHEYEVLANVDHGFTDIWNAASETAESNGLHEMKLHASSW